MILDTCALLWLAADSRRLTRTARRQIEKSAALYVSPISAYEIAVKASKGLLDLHTDPESWFGAMVDHNSLTVAPLDAAVCIAAAQLPMHHGDPFDRFIIATAKLNDLTVVTADENFEKYGLRVIC